MTKRTLSTAEKRREAVLEAALDVFAERGFLGTPTLPIAKAAGISQAYLFRLFPTKDDLVLAVIQRSNERLVTTFRRTAAAATARGEDPLPAMCEAYTQLVADRRILLLQMHGQALAASNPAVADAVRGCFREIVELLETETDHSPSVIQWFCSMGMLFNVLTAAGVTELDEPWARTLIAAPGPLVADLP